jgi:predicted O-methyltransferase YrrM
MYSTVRNLLFNTFKRGYAKVMLQKVLQRFCKSDSEQAREWALHKATMAIPDFCKAIDEELWLEAQSYCLDFQKSAKLTLSKISFELGGGGAYPLLYFLVRRYIPKVVIETGVAAGWSSLSILSALSKNKTGNLFSSDFPYFRMKDPERWIGLLVPESLKDRWHLDIRGDAVAIPNFLGLIGRKSVDFLHYDSDKSYRGRSNVLEALKNHFCDEAIVIMDDIQDNFYFRDFVSQNNLKFTVFEFEGKYIGLVMNVGRQLKSYS